MSGWIDAVLKALEKKHRTEQELLMSVLLDESSEDLRQEAREAGEQKRHKQIHELKEKRDELDFGVKGNLKVPLIPVSCAFYETYYVFKDFLRRNKNDL
jgi:hypothetical protein